MRNALLLLAALAGAALLGYVGGSCAADAKAEAADRRAEEATAVSDSLAKVRTADSSRFMQDSVKLAAAIQAKEDSLEQERARRRQAERARRVTVDASDLATASFDAALEVALPLLPPELGDTLAARRDREAETRRSERGATNRVLTMLEGENERLGELLALSREETANAIADRDGERALRLAETRRADANADARDAWRRAAGKWRLGTIGSVALLAVAGAVLILK